MYVANATPPPEGLGQIWGPAPPTGPAQGPAPGGYTQLAIGAAIDAWQDGGGEDIPNEVYYVESKLGITFCPGPWEVPRVRAAIDILPAASPLHGAISRYFVSGVSQRDADKWARYGRPRTALEQAGALVAEAHGGSDCQGGPESTAASSLIGQIIAEADEARGTAAGAARVATQAFTGLFQPAGPGAPANPLTSPLVLGAIGIGAVLLLRR